MPLILEGCSELNRTQVKIKKKTDPKKRKPLKIEFFLYKIDGQIVYIK